MKLAECYSIHPNRNIPNGSIQTLANFFWKSQINIFYIVGHIASATYLKNSKNNHATI